ncbi:MAG: hypothetical protein AAGB31_15015 [Bdellovibrio sp.]
MRLFKMALLKKILPLLVSLFTLPAFSGELEDYLKILYPEDSAASSVLKPIALPVGTQARIEETKLLKSGHYGLNLSILNGTYQNQNMWVSYNPALSHMKLYESLQNMSSRRTTSDFQSAQYIQTSAPLAAHPLPESARMKPVMEAIKQGNEAVKKHGAVGGPCADCEFERLHTRGADVVEESGLSSIQPKQTSENPVIREPINKTTPYGIRSARCGSRDGGYEECIFEGETSPGRFQFSNRGPNKIVPQARDGRSRDWVFNYAAGATQDMGISISDSPNGTSSQTQETYIMLFPRKTLPHIRVEGNKKIVTLPTGETVTYDAKTNEILSGVLTEGGAITAGGKNLQPAKISYNGNGIMVRVDHVGEEPRLNSRAKATITKGQQTCKVPVKDLWPDQNKNSSVHFRFPTDAEFEKYLKRTCVGNW